MAAQKGKDLLLKLDSDGAGTFVTVAGLRTRTLAFNAATVDVTDTESVGRWRELLEGAGVKTARITGSGIYKDAASDEKVRQYFFDGTIREWQGDRSGARHRRRPIPDRNPRICGAPIIFGGLGLAALGAKVSGAKAK
jgi:TP901-1 family phage major tail protein